MRRLLFSILLFFLAISGVELAQLPTCAVSGVTYSINGQPAAGIKIRVVRVEQNGSIISTSPLEATSASDGTWSLSLPRSSTAWFCVPGRPAAGISGNCGSPTKLSIPNTSSANFGDLVPVVNLTALGITVKDEGIPLATQIGAINFVGAGVSVAQSAAGAATATISGGGGGGGSLTAQEVDGSPSVTSVDTVRLDQADGFVVSNPGSGIARVDLSGVPYSAITLTGSVVNADVSNSAAIALSKLATVTGSRALASNSSGLIVASSVTDTELGYVAGVTSAIQTQLNGKAATSHVHGGADVTSGQIALARGGTGADLSATGAGYLKQATTGAAVTVGAIAAGDLPSAIDAAKTADGSVSNAEFQRLDGVTSGIQAQLDGKQSTGSYITALTGDVTASGPGSAAATLASSGVTAATYRSLTVDAKGRATAGTNPTTFAGYGLSDTSANLASSVTDETGSGALVFGTSPAFTTSQTTTQSGIGAVSSDGIVLQNTAAAADGAQQHSPRLRLTGQGWKTAATAASQPVDWLIENRPAQDVTAPKTDLWFSSRVNGGTPSDQIVFMSGGKLAFGGVGASNAAIQHNAGALNFIVANESRFADVTTRVNSSTDAMIIFNYLSAYLFANASFIADTGFERLAPSVLGIMNGQTAGGPFAGATAGGTFGARANSPAQITASQNDYNPGGTSYLQRWSTDASRNITGLTFTVTQVSGQTHLIINVGAANIVLTHQDTASTAANRFICPGAASVTLAADEAAYVVYDAATARWRVFKL